MNTKAPDYLNLKDKPSTFTQALTSMGFKPQKATRHLLDTGFLIISRNEDKVVSDDFYDETYFKIYTSYNHFKKGYSDRLEVTPAGREKLYQMIPDEFKKTEKELALWLKKQEQTMQTKEETQKNEDSLTQTFYELGEAITGSEYRPSEDSSCPF